jgi:hypothetical protein
VAGATSQYFFYAPACLLLCAPLALLPYDHAYAVLEVLTLALFALVMRAARAGHRLAGRAGGAGGGGLAWARKPGATRHQPARGRGAVRLILRKSSFVPCRWSRRSLSMVNKASIGQVIRMIFGRRAKN